MTEWRSECAKHGAGMRQQWCGERAELRRGSVRIRFGGLSTCPAPQSTGLLLCPSAVKMAYKSLLVFLSVYSS